MCSDNGSRLEAGDRLYDLLAEWEERRGDGPGPTAEELCPDDPALREQLEEWIAAQLRIEARLGLDVSPPEAASGGPPSRLPKISGLIVEEELGRGAMGVVYRARQLKFDRTVAVKVIAAGLMHLRRTGRGFAPKPWRWGGPLMQTSWPSTTVARRTASSTWSWSIWAAAPSRTG